MALQITNQLLTIIFECIATYVIATTILSYAIRTFYNKPISDAKVTLSICAAAMIILFAAVYGGHLL